jgi:hypothetical protein
MQIKEKFIAEAERIARAIESPVTAPERCAELVEEVEHRILQADISHPETIRRLLPFVLALTEERGGPVNYWLGADEPVPACHACGVH